MEPVNIESVQDLGRAVRQARKEAGLSQMDLAKRCGCSQRLVSEIERGKPTAELGKALALLQGLGVSLVAGSGRAPLDGRAEVEYAIVRIANDLDRQPRKRRPLSDYLAEGDR